MYHYSNIGLRGESCGPSSPILADIDGFIPQAGDQWEDMNWPSDFEWTPEEWNEAVENVTGILSVRA